MPIPETTERGQATKVNLGKETHYASGLIMNASMPCPIGKVEEGSGKVRCACGRWFWPDTTVQKFCDHACYSASLRVPIEQRFWTKVNRFGPPPAHLPHLGDCWLFTAKARLREYGAIAGVLDGRRRPLYVHRVSWELHFGRIPDGLSVLHRCDTPLCVRPDHLFLGTQQDNLADARHKGRSNEFGRRSPLIGNVERVRTVELEVRGEVA